ERRRAPREHALEREQQLADRDRTHRLGELAIDRLRERAREDVAPEHRPRRQRRRDLLEALVLDELLDELGLGVERLLVLELVALVGREQLERPLEHLELDGVGIAHDDLPDGSGGPPMPIAARTSAIVRSATRRARAVPAASTSRASPGRSASSRRRSRSGARSAMTCLIITRLQSTQPMPAVRHPSVTYAISSGVQYTRWRLNAGQSSGSPGSVRRTRRGSVAMRVSRASIDAGSSSRKIALP